MSDDIGVGIDANEKISSVALIRASFNADTDAGIGVDEGIDALGRVSVDADIDVGIGADRKKKLIEVSIDTDIDVGISANQKISSDALGQVSISPRYRRR